MKTIVALALTLVLTAALLVGCGCTNRNIDSTSAPTVLPTNEEIWNSTEATTRYTTEDTTSSMTTDNGTGSMDNNSGSGNNGSGSGNNGSGSGNNSSSGGNNNSGSTDSNNGTTTATESGMESRARRMMPGTGTR